VQATNTRPRFEPTADAHGLCSHAGVVLLAELADRQGLTQELGRRANLGLVRQGGGHAHERGAVLRDLVVLLADGGDCVSDLAVLRYQAGLFGRVCSTSTAWRLIGQVAADPRGVTIRSGADLASHLTAHEVPSRSPAPFVMTLVDSRGGQW
jgi:hypothetical protein